jgi:hypothetical protein
MLKPAEGGKNHQNPSLHLWQALQENEAQQQQQRFKIHLRAGTPSKQILSFSSFVFPNLSITCDSVSRRCFLSTSDDLNSNQSFSFLAEQNSSQAAKIQVENRSDSVCFLTAFKARGLGAEIVASENEQEGEDEHQTFEIKLIVKSPPKIQAEAKHQQKNIVAGQVLSQPPFGYTG